MIEEEKIWDYLINMINRNVYEEGSIKIEQSLDDKIGVLIKDSKVSIYFIIKIINKFLEKDEIKIEFINSYEPNRQMAKKELFEIIFPEIRNNKLKRIL